MSINYRPFSAVETLMCASLSTRLVGIHGGVNATANICDPAGAILHQTPIRTNGAGGSIPGWVFNLGTDNRRRGDAELKVLRDVEDWIANGAAPAFYVYILRWSSKFGHNNRFAYCHFPFIDGGRQIAQC